MKISTKGRYGIRAAIELAERFSALPVALPEIAFRQDIPEKYLEQLLQTMKKAGIVQSVRGVQGGYLLARPPAEISIGEVLRALEGRLSPADCVESGDCGRNKSCAMRLLYERIEKSVAAVVDGTTLKELVDQQTALNLEATP